MTQDLSTQLSAVVGEAFEALGLDAKLGAVKRSDRPDLADFQCNGAMPAAKQVGRNPREIAAEIAERLSGKGQISDVTVAGPGFLNIKLTADAVSAAVEAIRADEKAGGGSIGSPEHVVIDFGGPNVAKPMHVGHLRTAVIGDTLQRVFRFLGDRVTSDAHLGDWGLQMGHLITELQDEQPELPYFDASNEGPFPETPPVTIEDLGRLYPQASGKAKADPARNERSQKAVAELQKGRAGYRALLRHFINVSVAALKKDYAFLNVSFDLWKGEADAEPFIAPMVEDLKTRGLAVEDDGAWVIHVARDGENVPVEKNGETRIRNPMPPFMLINSLGGTGYHATDLATIVDRVENLKPDRMLYVVDQRQALHFEQVFRAADKAGLFPRDRMEHIGFGTVNGTDGKPFKTREGGVLRLADLNAMAMQEADSKLSDEKLPDGITAEERADIAAMVALAALRFADLQNQRTTNYIFDLDKFTSFEGKTGPYLMYQAVRIKSVLRKAGEAGHSAGAIRIESAKERALVLQLDGFAGALASVHAKRMPHFLCEHLYTLSQAFAAFYAEHPIATEPDTEIRASRIGLVEAVLKQLETGLDLLGIKVPERM